MKKKKKKKIGQAKEKTLVCDEKLSEKCEFVYSSKR